MWHVVVNIFAVIGGLTVAEVGALVVLEVRDRLADRRRAAKVNPYLAMRRSRFDDDVVDDTGDDDVPEWWDK